MPGLLRASPIYTLSSSVEKLSRSRISVAPNAFGVSAASGFAGDTPANRTDSSRGEPASTESDQKLFNNAKLSHKFPRCGLQAMEGGAPATLMIPGGLADSLLHVIHELWLSQFELRKRTRVKVCSLTMEAQNQYRARPRYGSCIGLSLR
jgi:hypothetical protein